MDCLYVPNCIESPATCRDAGAARVSPTIHCYVYPIPTATLFPLSRDRKLTLEALSLLMHLDDEITVARADWNQDRFRRLMSLRPKVVTRIRRRWEKLNPSPSSRLGTLRRRYHANMAGHFYELTS